MIKYAKLINETTIEFPPKNKGGVMNYDTNIPLLIEDGYKELVEAQKEKGKSYKLTYKQTKTKIIETATEIIPDPTELLKEAKEQKIIENDFKRDEVLNSGVEYRGVLFDSDTDQKVNLLATVSVLDDESVVIWFGMNNIPLACTKEDLVNIGNLIIELDTFCWTRNAEIKAQINSALTVEQVNGIEINYERVEQ